MPCDSSLHLKPVPELAFLAILHVIDHCATLLAQVEHTTCDQYVQRAGDRFAPLVTTQLVEREILKQRRAITSIGSVSATVVRGTG